MKDLCRGRTEEQTPEWTVPMGGHHDRIDVFLSGILHNRPGRVAFPQDALHPEAAPFV